MSDRTTVRIPTSWRSELDSAQALEWIAAHLQSPVPLPLDPGPGDARVDLGIPKPTLRALTRITGEPASASLRRLFALNLGVPPVETQVWTTAEPLERVPDLAMASSRELGEQNPAHDPAVSDQGLVFHWIAEKLARPNRSPSDARLRARTSDSFLAALDWEFARFNRSGSEEAKMQLAVDPPADPHRWGKLGLVIFVALMALVIWLAMKSRGRVAAGPAPLPAFAPWMPIIR